LIKVIKNSIDLGIVTKDSQRALKFYRDTLGLEYEGELAIPGGSMQRLKCGDSVIKLVELKRPPRADGEGGGLQGATGYRYMTLTVGNLSEILANCESAGYKIAMPKTEIRVGVSIGFVEDPDGNWLEFLEVAGE
jgi:glyoxylase I family protein